MCFFSCANENQKFDWILFLVTYGTQGGCLLLICASFLVQMRIRSLIEFCFWSLMVHKFCNNVDSPKILLVLGYKMKAIKPAYPPSSFMSMWSIYMLSFSYFAYKLIIPNPQATADG
ncbi:hypothetical protein SO802_023670 [Lithocarpus litseifolius]|uniref:Uncharacterized protein n=1 Tax=Lithocarpus litseifolius TaxID=425828 RepID=A0AAW2C8U6_9ROSI